MITVDFVPGTKVRALRGLLKSMSPEPRFVGMTGEIIEVITDVTGVYYKVDFGFGCDFISADCLQELRF